MTRDDIIQMARDAGLMPTVLNHWPFELKRFAKLVAAAEREAIISIIPGGRSVDPQWLCDEIRARGDA